MPHLLGNAMRHTIEQTSRESMWTCGQGTLYGDFIPFAHGVVMHFVRGSSLTLALRRAAWDSFPTSTGQTSVAHLDHVERPVPHRSVLRIADRRS